MLVQDDNDSAMDKHSPALHMPQPTPARRNHTLTLDTALCTMWH
jgi:hypothetical protein